MQRRRLDEEPRAGGGGNEGGWREGGGSRAALDERVTRRRQVVHMLVMEKNRVEGAADKRTLASIRKVIRVLEQQRKDLEPDRRADRGR
jgi:hypothetical protein